MINKHCSGNIFACVILILPFMIGGSLSHASASTNKESKSLVRRAAGLILEHQASDGAIAMGVVQRSQGSYDISPYCANLAGIGLVAAYGALHDKRYLQAAENWAIWQENHIRRDGVIEDYKGFPGSWKPTGHYDSTDSYASTWLDLVEKIYQAGVGMEWLKARWTGVLKISHAMELTRQANGMTCATPKWPVMYTMDNVETHRGIEAAIRIGTELRHPQFAQREREWGKQLDISFEKTLWNPIIKRYDVGIQTNGSIAPFKGEWYPSGMANIMVVAWEPVHARTRSLYADMRRTDGLPSICENGDDMKRIAFWLMAAQRVRAIKDAESLAKSLDTASDSIWANQYPDVLGFICRGASKE